MEKINYVRKILLALISFLLVYSSCFAQEALKSAVSVTTLGDIIEKGGPLMYPLAILSFLGLCLIIYYFLTLRIEMIVPPSLTKQFEEKKKDLEVMSQICSDDESPLSKVIIAGIETLKKPKSTYAMLRDAVEDEGARQGSVLWQRIQYLQDLAIVSPMIGLLGTVIGMIQSFSALPHDAMTPRPTLIAKGVSMALITTATGLIIGILAMIVYAYFRGRVNHLISELESASSRISREMIRLATPEPTDKAE